MEPLSVRRKRNLCRTDNQILSPPQDFLQAFLRLGEKNKVTQTCGSFSVKHLDIHNVAKTRCQYPLRPSGVFTGKVDAVCIPIRPIDCRLKYIEAKRVRQIRRNDGLHGTEKKEKKKRKKRKKKEENISAPLKPLTLNIYLNLNHIQS